MPAHVKLTPYRQLKGFATRYTSRGWCVVELDYFADPSKDAAWFESQCRKLLNYQQVRREYLRDWTSSSGKAFYPEFQLNRDRYIRRAPGLIEAPVYRGFDFGYRKAACLFLQYSGTERRVWMLRELLPDNIDTYSLAILARYVSGQEDRSILSKWPKAAYWVSFMEREHKRDPIRMPMPPWFPPETHFIDYAGPEANKVSATVESGTKERTDAQVFASLGIHLNIYSSSLEDREILIRSLLHIREDGLPGLFIDPACFHMTNGFNGGIAYPDKGTIANPFPNSPRKDGHYEHLNDCAGYVIVNIVPKMMDPRQGSARGQAVSLGLKESEDSVWD